jgi:hypothetical protein
VQGQCWGPRPRREMSTARTRAAPPISVTTRAARGTGRRNGGGVEADDSERADAFATGGSEGGAGDSAGVGCGAGLTVGSARSAGGSATAAVLNTTGAPMPGPGPAACQALTWRRRAGIRTRPTAPAASTRSTTSQSVAWLPLTAARSTRTRAVDAADELALPWWRAGPELDAGRVDPGEPAWAAEAAVAADD